jgi:hypothetical protein
MRTRWVGRLIAPLTVAAFVAGARISAYADTVKCKDGTESQAGRGACSHHGGVAAAAAAPAATHPTGQVAAPKAAPPAAAPPPAAPLPPAPPPTNHATTRSTTHAAPPPASGRPTAQCRDGSWSYAQHHTGACSRHGGVARWTDGTAP